MLGFLSGVDELDVTSSGPTFNSDNVYADVQPIDLYRYSIESKAVGAIDWTADGRTSIFLSMVVLPLWRRFQQGLPMEMAVRPVTGRTTLASA